MAHDLNVLALVKGAERFVFVYDDASREVLIQNFQELAGRTDANFTWFDVQVLTRKVREQTDDSLTAAELD